jgi:hypothetical protein
VAACADHCGVLSREWETGLAMVHSLAAGFPVNQREIRAVVIGMARCANVARGIGAYPHGMHPAALRHTFADLRVALKTF